ncbi:MAG: hypothetical protein L6Q77_11030 [Bacteroidetes bacterium]|nr:hypothetical protein [Bacteroidota bacterium]
MKRYGFLLVFLMVLTEGFAQSPQGFQVYTSAGQFRVDTGTEIWKPDWTAGIAAPVWTQDPWMLQIAGEYRWMDYFGTGPEPPAPFYRVITIDSDPGHEAALALRLSRSLGIWQEVRFQASAQAGLYSLWLSEVKVKYEDLTTRLMPPFEPVSTVSIPEIRTGGLQFSVGAGVFYPVWNGVGFTAETRCVALSGQNWLSEKNASSETQFRIEFNLGLAF